MAKTSVLEGAGIAFCEADECRSWVIRVDFDRDRASNDFRYDPNTDRKFNAWVPVAKGQQETHALQ